MKEKKLTGKRIKSKKNNKKKSKKKKKKRFNSQFVKHGSKGTILIQIHYT